MIIGVFSDLHSNFPALRAMEKVAGQVDQWVSLGDSVGLFPDVNEVLDWQRKHNVICVRGDHEEALVGSRELSWSRSATESIERQAKVLSTENRDHISRLPSVEEIVSEGLRLRFTHFVSETSGDPLGKYSLNIDNLEKTHGGCDFVFFGHTHLRAVIYGRGTVFVNPGSAGFPIDVGKSCSFVLFDTDTRAFRTVSFSYDSDELIASIDRAKFNPLFKQYVADGHRWPT